MKSLTAFTLFVAATLITVGSASAQAPVEKGYVPFNFAVGDHAMPAGNYTIRPEGTSPHLLSLNNWDKGARLLTFGQSNQDNPNHVDTLVFDKVGDQYYLRDIRSSTLAMNIHFATSKAEKRAKAQVEEAGRFVDDPVLIALN